MKKLTRLLLLLLAVFLMVGVTLVGASEGSGVDLFTPNPDDDPIPEDWPDEPGLKPPLAGGEKADRPMVIIDSADLPSLESVTETTIDVWYGKDQNFGQLGNPQKWINILGNVSAPAGVKSLAYILNNDGQEIPLTIGPSNRRLAAEGDFNIEIDIEDLKNGDNDVEIIATDQNDIVTTENVTVDYTPNVIWQEDYEADWQNCADLQSCTQVVDGNWVINNQDKLMLKDPSAMGYDRLVAFGDSYDGPDGWSEYEVMVPITVKGILGDGFNVEGAGPGIGIITRWNGHVLNEDEQPRLGWEQLGALGWYVWQEENGAEGLKLMGYKWSGGESTAKKLDFNKTYLFKMSVQNDVAALQAVDEGRAYFRLKFWEQGKDEPFGWDLESFSPKNPQVPIPESGSAVLIAHYVDAEFGNVTITPLADLNDIELTTEVQGNGTITKNPNVGAEYQFAYGEIIKLTAVPEANHILERWEFSDGTTVPGTEEKLTLSMTSNVTVRAVFKEASPGKIIIQKEGEGEVTKSPDKQTYDAGEIVTLMAIPAPGYLFQQWGGDLAGNLSRETIRIDGDRTVKAIFIEASAASPLSDDFSQCALDTNVWTWVNPSGDGSYEMTGSSIELSVSGGSPHTLWADNKDAPRIMQNTVDQDFSVVLKFESIPEKRYQIQGFMAEQDEINWLRFDIHNDGTDVLMFRGKQIDGKSNGSKIKVNTDGASEIYMRVRRVGDTWTQAYSLDGTNWSADQVLEQALDVVSTGVFVGNQPDNVSPAYTAKVDYFMNASFPIDPEDAAQGSALVVNVEGEGLVQQNPEPNEQNRYACNQEVTLTAVPEFGWNFGGWSGDASGSNQSITVLMNQNREVTATFTQGPATETGIFLPMVLAP